MATASSPPISPEVAVIVSTAARVMISQRLTTSILRSGDRLTVSRTSFQLRSNSMGILTA